MGKTVLEKNLASVRAEVPYVGQDLLCVLVPLYRQVLGAIKSSRVGHRQTCARIHCEIIQCE